jgi:myo-inositol 2-dehydrogenase/D-chiro-inositol 1-dehydrogenase
LIACLVTWQNKVSSHWPERFGLAFDAEFRAFIAAAAKGGAAGPSAWDGYVATAAGLAGVTALASGAREPIELLERPSLYAP